VRASPSTCRDARERPEFAVREKESRVAACGVQKCRAKKRHSAKKAKAPQKAIPKANKKRTKPFGSILFDADFRSFRGNASGTASGWWRFSKLPACSPPFLQWATSAGPRLGQQACHFSW